MDRILCCSGRVAHSVNLKYPVSKNNMTNVAPSKINVYVPKQFSILFRGSPKPMSHDVPFSLHVCIMFIYCWICSCSEYARNIWDIRETISINCLFIVSSTRILIYIIGSSLTEDGYNCMLHQDHLVHAFSEFMLLKEV